MTPIENLSVTTSVLKKNAVQNIFLGTKTKWKDGGKIIFVVQKNTAGHEDFLENISKKAQSDFTAI